MLRFGWRIGLMPFVLIKTKMAAGRQGLGFVSDPADSSAARRDRSPVPLPSFNEVCHPRMDIACSCAACASDWFTAHGQNNWRRICVWEERKSAARRHIPKQELAKCSFLARVWPRLLVSRAACFLPACTCSQPQPHPAHVSREGRGGLLVWITPAPSLLTADKAV